MPLWRFWNKKNRIFIFILVEYLPRPVCNFVLRYYLFSLGIKYCLYEKLSSVDKSRWGLLDRHTQELLDKFLFTPTQKWHKA